MLTFLVGGARSGKSTLAVELGVRHDGDVVFVATAEPVDDDLRDRIAAHRAERPGWPTVEAAIELAAAIDAAGLKVTPAAVIRDRPAAVAIVRDLRHQRRSSSDGGIVADREGCG